MICDLKEFLDPIPISKMWGVGKKTQESLGHLKIFTFRDLRRSPVEILERGFGKQGIKMHLLAMGIDDRDVIPHHDAKSMGHEETYSVDVLDILSLVSLLRSGLSH